LIAWAPRVGTDVVTVCTGSRDPESMWRKHPDNDTPEAWADLLVQIERAVQLAEEYGVTLGVEPEIERDKFGTQSSTASRRGQVAAAG
jgi:sugar phosphate isomerase/epimerase